MQYNDIADKEAAKSRVHVGALSETRMESEDKPIQLEYGKFWDDWDAKLIVRRSR